MFAAVGRDFTPETVGTPNWFADSSWTMGQFDEFRRWMVREGMRRMRWRKRQATKEAGMFLLLYGWTIEPARPKPESKSAPEKSAIPKTEGNV
jgi:hypothetical protein